MTKDHPYGAWAPFEEFILAGRVTTENAMRFRDECNKVRRSHGTSVPNFRRALFAALMRFANLKSVEEVAEKFGFAKEEIPVDQVTDAPEVAAQLLAARREIGEANQKLNAAQVRAEEAAARLEKIDQLSAELPRLVESLEYLATMPATWEADIASIEAAIERSVYSMPAYSQIGHPDSFVANSEMRIAGCRAAIAAHPARIAKARGVIAGIKNEIAHLKGGKAKKT